MSKLLLACSLSILAFAAHADEGQSLTSLATQAVAQTRKDPEAAQFRNVAIRDGGKTRIVCGEVNGKNSYGGYVGFRKFFVYEDSLNVLVKKGDPIMDQLVDLACKPNLPNQ
jgi:hypothetical protein